MFDSRPRGHAKMPPPNPAEQERVYSEFGYIYQVRVACAFGVLASLGLTVVMMPKFGMGSFLLPLAVLIGVWKPLIRIAKCPYCGHDFRPPGSNKADGGNCYACGVRLRKNRWI